MLVRQIAPDSGMGGARNFDHWCLSICGATGTAAFLPCYCFWRMAFVLINARQETTIEKRNKARKAP